MTERPNRVLVARQPSAASPARTDVITRTWAAVWGRGCWCITTDAHVPALQFVEWAAGQRRIGLLDGWGV